MPHNTVLTNVALVPAVACGDAAPEPAPSRGFGWLHPTSCVYCGAPAVDGADHPYPYVPACSDMCSILAAHTKPEEL